VGALKLLTDAHLENPCSLTLCASTGEFFNTIRQKRPFGRLYRIQEDRHAVERRAKFSEDTHVLIRTPDHVFAECRVHAATALTAAALGSSCGEEACGLFGELFKKLEVRAVPGIGIEDQPGIR
jgi:hypothetical protein